MSERYTHDPADVLDTIDCALSYNGGAIQSEDIAELIRWAEDNTRDYGGDGDDLAAVVRLKDGRFAAIEGWADYSGWDCQSGVEVTFHDSAEDAWRNGIGTDARALIERAEADRGDA